MVASKGVQAMKTTSSLAALLLLWFFTGLANPGLSGALETADFVVRDLTGQLSHEQIRRLTSGAEEKLGKILDFWGVDSGVERLGKIRLEFAKPRGSTYATVFLMMKDGDSKVRVVRIYGVTDEPEMVAHKLTHALFPSGDKLVRNMMGIPMEVLFGNPHTFPLCGFSHDEWVSVFRRTNSFVPLSALGPDHEPWGMTTHDGVPVVKDKARQHVMYAESGSFGSFLLNAYGAEKVKRFYRLSAGMKRPWEEVLGASLADLEAKWLQFLDSRQKPDEAHMKLLMKMVQDDPNNACSEAQELAGKKKSRLPTDFRQVPPGLRRTR
jgi:hypothetical protein